MAQTRYNFCMPVWGPEYIDILLSVGLASQMVSGNLRDFPWAANSIYEFYTTPSDADVLRSAPLVRRLMEWMEVRFIPIGHVESRGKWNTLRRAHQMAVKSADDRDAAILFLSPDQIWSQGSFTNACHRIIEGWSAVLGPGLRSVREAMVPRLRDLYLEFDGSLPIASRDLVREGLATRHPETLMWFWGTPGHFKCPTYLLFDVAEQGVSAFCYILHPVVLNAQVRGAPFQLIFDQDYLEAACPDISRLYIARDSDEVCQFEVSPGDMALPGEPWPALDGIAAMRRYGEFQYNQQHRQFAKSPVRLHYVDCQDDAWTSVERRGRDVVDMIEAGWRDPDHKLLWSRPIDLSRRMEARYRFNKSEMPASDRRLLRTARLFGMIQCAAEKLRLRPTSADTLRAE